MNDPDLLDTLQIAAMRGFDSRGGARGWLKRQGLRPVHVERRLRYGAPAYLYRADDVRVAIERSRARVESGPDRVIVRYGREYITLTEAARRWGLGTAAGAARRIARAGLSWSFKVGHSCYHAWDKINARVGGTAAERRRAGWDKAERTRARQRAERRAAGLPANGGVAIAPVRRAAVAGPEVLECEERRRAARMAEQDPAMAELARRYGVGMGGAA